MQHGDGGFGWWIEDPTSSPYITVYVVQALTIARDLGYPVDATMLANAVSYLLANAQSPAATDAGVNYDANLQAAIVYAVTRYGRGQDVTGSQPSSLMSAICSAPPQRPSWQWRCTA